MIPPNNKKKVHTENTVWVNKKETQIYFQISEKQKGESQN